MPEVHRSRLMVGLLYLFQQFLIHIIEYLCYHGTMAHSIDIRARVVRFVRSGGSKAEAARIYEIGRSQVYRWMRLGDNLSAAKTGPKKAHKVDMAALDRLINDRPDAQLKELAAELGVGLSTVHYGLKRLNYSRKKNA